MKGFPCVTQKLSSLTRTYKKPNTLNGPVLVISATITTDRTPCRPFPIQTPMNYGDNLSTTAHLSRLRTKI